MHFTPVNFWHYSYIINCTNVICTRNWDYRKKGFYCDALPGIGSKVGKLRPAEVSLDRCVVHMQGVS